MNWLVCKIQIRSRFYVLEFQLVYIAVQFYFFADFFGIRREGDEKEMRHVNALFREVIKVSDGVIFS